MKQIPQWLVDEIADGLAALLALRLKNAPAEDTVELTADIWERAFSRRLGVPVEALDAPRIREGFDRIFPTVREWPTPTEVFGLMPPRPPQKALPVPEREGEPVEEVRSMVVELLKEMDIRDMLKKETTDRQRLLRDYEMHMKGEKP